MKKEMYVYFFSIKTASESFLFLINHVNDAPYHKIFSELIKERIILFSHSFQIRKIHWTNFNF